MRLWRNSSNSNHAATSVIDHGCDAQGRLSFVGTVAMVVESIDGQRHTIILNHSQQIKTHYAHLSKVLVNQGQRVRMGQPIAQVGNRGKSTGPHLHYEVRVAGVAIDPRQNLLSARQAE